MFDLNFGSAKLDKKWNIGNFITSSYKTARGISVNGSDASDVDLNKIIASINRDFGRNEKDYDSLYRELMLKRNETKKEVAEMKANNAKYMDIISAQGNDINIMSTQLRILEDKQKLTSEKYKTIQAEKKLWKDLQAKNDTSNDKSAVNNFITNSPLSVGQMANGGGIGANTPKTISLESLGALPVNEYKQSEDFLKPIAETANKELEEAKNEESSEKELAKSSNNIVNNIVNNPVPGSDIAVSKDLFGNVTKTVADQLDEKMDIVKARFARKDALLTEHNGLGHDYSTSIDNLVMNKTPHQVRLFVNPDTGRFWEKAFTRDAEGNYTIEAKAYHPRGITHLGDLQFDVVARKVVTYYDDTPIDFEIDRNENHMGEFYINEWNDPKNDKFSIPADICNQMVSIMEA